MQLAGINRIWRKQQECNIQPIMGDVGRKTKVGTGPRLYIKEFKSAVKVQFKINHMKINTTKCKKLVNRK